MAFGINQLFADADLPSDAGAAVDPSVSWLFYQCAVVTDEDDHIAVQMPLAGDAKPAADQGLSATGPVDALRKNTDVPKPAVTSNVEPIVQRVSPPLFTVRLVGEAMRVHHPVEAPALLSYGGKKVVQRGRRHVTTTAGSMGGFRINYVSFDIEYVVLGVPAQYDLPADVTSNMNGTGK
jgi:hypothetical protein